MNWGPQFAEIASSNDFGYTTGPWEFRGGANNNSLMARGQYTTVWHIDKDGHWKFLADLGVSNTPKVPASGLTKIKTQKIKGDANMDELLKAEQNFIAIYKAD